MKKTFIFSFLILIFWSCNLLEEANTIKLSSKLVMNVPVEVNASENLNLKSLASFTFSETGHASLADDEDLVKYLNKIKSIDIKNVRVYFTGIQEEQVIETVVLTVTGVGEFASLSNVTSNNTSYSLEISADKLNQVADYLKNNHEITVILSGTTNSAPMSFTIKTEYDLSIEAKAL